MKRRTFKPPAFLAAAPGASSRKTRAGAHRFRRPAEDVANMTEAGHPYWGALIMSCAGSHVEGESIRSRGG